MLVNEIYYRYLHVKSGVVRPEGNYHDKVVPELPPHGERAGDSYLQLQYATNSSIYAFPPSMTGPYKPMLHTVLALPATKSQCSGDCLPKSGDSLKKSNSKLTVYI